MAVKTYNISPALFDGVTAVYYGGLPAQLLDSSGNSLIGELPDAPTIIGSIADRSYSVGGAAVTIDLATKFSGATSYAIAPTNLPGVTISGAVVTIDPNTAIAQTTITVSATNSGGTVSQTFALTVSAALAAPAVIAAPTIAGGTTEGSILTRTAGDASGNPAPARETVWLLDGAAIAGQTGNTLDTTGRVGVITTQDIWTNSEGTATGTSDAVTIVSSGSDALSVQVADGRALVSGSGDVTWTDPLLPEYAGTFTMDQSDEYSGALNVEYTETTAPQCIVAPVISRVGGPDDTVGSTYRALPGLWQIGGSDDLSVDREWYFDGVATGIDGSEDFTPVAAGDVQMRSVATVAGKAARNSRSNTIAVAAPYTGTQTIFTSAPDGTSILALDDPSGRTWTQDPFIGSGNAFLIYNGYPRNVKATGVPYFAYPSDSATNGAKATFLLPVTQAEWNIYNRSDASIAPAIQIGITGATAGGYFALINASTMQMQLHRLVGTTTTQLGSGTTLTGAYLGTEVTIGIYRDSGDVVVTLNGTEDFRITDNATEIANNLRSGISGRQYTQSANYAVDFGMTAFDVGV